MSSIRFRSLLELSVIRMLEDEGLVLGSTMLYEATRIPYGKSLKRTYVVDLTLPQMRTLVEVKPLSRVHGRRNISKRSAAEKWAHDNDWTYVIVTEHDISKCGKVLTLKEAAKISEVRLDDKTLRRLTRQKKLKKRIRK